MPIECRTAYSSASSAGAETVEHSTLLELNSTPGRQMFWQIFKLFAALCETAALRCSVSPLWRERTADTEDR